MPETMGCAQTKKTSQQNYAAAKLAYEKQKQFKVSPELGRLLSTYQLVPSFQMSSKHHCYIDSLDNIDELPVPAPPVKKKSEVFDVSLFSDVDQRALKAPARLLLKPLSTLVQYLVSGYEDDLSKIRVIYRWITAQSIEGIKSGKREPPQAQALYQLWRIKNRKGNYAQLVSLLCRFAQIPCIIIHGKLKGSTYDVGEKLDEEQHYGEWNAVLIDGCWRFINAYWGTCAEGGSDDNQWEVIDRGENMKGDPIVDKILFYSCDENYFLTDPEHLVSTHLPNNPEWQLLQTPVLEEKFEQQAYLKDRYFNLNMKLISPDACVVTSEDGEAEFRFELPIDKVMQLDFQYLLLRMKSSTGNQPRYDRYVFLQRQRENILCIKLRSPIADTFKFELVGKDISVTDPTYDYDWIAIYKIIFLKEKEDCKPFPECPIIGWGPGRQTMECGLAPMSHFGGEIKPKENGQLELKFSPIDGKDWRKMKLRGELITGGSDPQVLSDHVINRYENGDVIFNVNTPRKGEYALKLYAKDQDDENAEDENFCNYLVTSDRQVGENYAFPRGFQDVVGAKEGFESYGLRPLSHPSGLIETDEEEIELQFENPEGVELSINLSGAQVRPEVAKRLITEEQEEDVMKYKVRLPQNGNYGVKVMASRGNGAPFENVFDYVINYKKSRRKKKKEDQKTNQRVEVQENSSSSIPDKLRKCIKTAITEQNEVELEMYLDELKALGLPTTKADIEHAETELELMKCRRELTEATSSKDMDAIKAALKVSREKEFDFQLQAEVIAAKSMLERLRKMAKLLHAVLALDQKTIAEIKSYQVPPPAVHRVMMATLLLLGHWEEETEDWKNIQQLLGKLGKEAIKRRIQELKIDDIPVDVALGSRDLLRDFTLDQVRMVSAGGATFYVWVKGLTEEIEKRNAENLHNIRPRTSKSRRRERTMIQ